MTACFALVSAHPDKVPWPDYDDYAYHLLRSLSFDVRAWRLADQNQAILQDRCNRRVLQVQYRLDHFRLYLTGIEICKLGVDNAHNIACTQYVQGQASSQTCMLRWSQCTHNTEWNMFSEHRPA